MILLISICREKLHELEFVKPVEDILKNSGQGYFVKSYVDLNKEDLAKAEKVIICGTSLKDNEFSEKENFRDFHWIKNFNKPLLGVCAGMQIIGLVFDGKIKKKAEIGFYEEFFKKDFLGLNGKQEVWHLHNNFVDFNNLKDFEVFCFGNGVSQAIKHKVKEIYGVLFHPEVRNKELIERFVNLS